ncbi:MAG TPA: FxsA family protein [Solirubrobacteraceae bacterium]|nr:FxsA family protein [Solirubrobacteraceae bacterium]
MFLLLLLLFIVVPLVELYVIIQVGQAIGVLPTIALLLLDSLLGTALLRSQGRGAWQRFNAALGAGRVPAREVADGAMIVVGGALLLTPGFVTDVFGILFLLPPTRALLRRLLARAVGRRIVVATPFGTVRPGASGGRGPRQRGGEWDVEGTAHDVDAGPERLPR